LHIEADRKYLVLPVNNTAPLRDVILTRGGVPVYTLNVKLDAANPSYHSYITLSRFTGESLEINLADAEFNVADSLPGDIYTERLRPQVHFTPRLGWTNDPNGLVYYNGTYHLFFQHNPAGTQWGNMHWGHAVSHDLIHWEEKDIALYPDGFGTMFSGSAIIDRRNVTGLKTGDYDVILLFYTAAGDIFTQCMAYSADGGETFIKYAGNPVVPNITGSNRDPKVIWCGELESYIMALYLDGNTYALLRSDNLICWSILQRLELPGDSECPDFYPLEYNGIRYWVFSGASDHYYIGGFKDGLFMPAQEHDTMHDIKNVLYAAQTYSDIPAGRRIRFSWDTTAVAGDAGMPFNCAMSVPVDISIRRRDARLKLCAYPIPEFDSLRIPYNTVEETACDIEAVILTQKNPSFTVFGHTEPLDSIPADKDGSIRVRIIADRTGYEAYFGDGEYYIARGFECNLGLSPLETENAEIKSINIYGLKSIWN
jgi:sucrose-6-phosphate hydrolase SacC (GH32 family)